MTTNNDEPKILPRSFIARITEHLAKITDDPIAVRSEWRMPIEEYPVAYTLNVPLDAELVVPLVPRHADFERMRHEDIEREALAFANALVNLNRGRRFLQDYARKIRREALIEVEKIRGNGVDMRFNGISFRETRADALTQDDWKSALFHVIAEVRISICGLSGLREEQIICVEEPHHVAQALVDDAERQQEWQDARDLLDRQQADLRIGRVCLEVIKATGIPLEHVLQSIGRGERWYHTGEDGGMAIAGQCEGKVEASLEMRNGYWNGRELSLTGPEADQAGKTVRKGPDLFSHPAFTDVLIENGLSAESPGTCVKVDNPADWLVDLESGRIWQDAADQLPIGEAADRTPEPVLD
ncbi:hypothetical protein [Qipengyuania sp. YIM B01966]|uniref:hypothetical protein n=1 Tax=Qipengyuania sp. YIM B01966 TaxID=2778646 RepID=UPI0018F55A78|nr:hypothetical protein [Qipengyuania sp. YIM B01966]